MAQASKELTSLRKPSLPMKSSRTTKPAAAISHSVRHADDTECSCERRLLCISASVMPTVKFSRAPLWGRQLQRTQQKVANAAGTVALNDRKMFGNRRLGSLFGPYLLEGIHHGAHFARIERPAA